MSQRSGVANFLASQDVSAPMRQKVGAWWVAGAIVVTLLVGATGWWTAQRTMEPDNDGEIAVLVSRSNSTTWPRLVQSFSAEARRNGWVVSEAATEYPGRLRIVFPDGGAVLFRLYKELGHAGLRQRVLDLCDQSRPPIAILSGSNSGSARIIATALHDRDRPNRPAPVFVLTSGTVDDLTAIHPEKTFRFGHKNSRQAKEVVGSLAKLYDDQGRDPLSLRVAIVEIEDDTFACEFSKLVKKQLIETFGEGRVKFETLKLPTGIGTFDDPTEQERKIAAHLAREMSSVPAQSWVIVLPAAADVYRRFWLSLFEALQEVGADRMAQHFGNLTYVAGDSLDFSDFSGPLKAENLRATAIFYAQYDSRLEGESVPSPERVREALYHEIGRTVLAVLADPEARKSAEVLRNAFAGYRRNQDGPAYFDGPERRGGGGPIVVRSQMLSSGEQKFQFIFPTEMK
jgi:hypothetical protein